MRGYWLGLRMQAIEGNRFGLSGEHDPVRGTGVHLRTQELSLIKPGVTRHRMDDAPVSRATPSTTYRSERASTARRGGDQ